MIQLKRDSLKTPWGMKLKGGEGTGKQLAVTLVINNNDNNKIIITK